MTCACATFVNKCHAIDTPTPLHRHYEVKRQHLFSLGMKRTSLLATRVCPFTGLDVWTSGLLDVWNTGLDYWTSGILDWTTGRLEYWTGLLDVWNTGLDYWTSGILDWTTGRLEYWTGLLDVWNTGLDYWTDLNHNRLLN